MFAHFFKQKSPLLQQWIRRLIKDETSTPEVLQDVFIQIWIYRDKLAEVDNLIAWLKTVTTHQCFKHLARQKAHYARSGGDITKDTLLPSTRAEAEDHISYKEMQSLVRKALATLTPQQQEIYRLSREEGLSSSEIAQQLNISRGHVRNTISTILASIRTYLQQSGKIWFIGWLIFLK